LRDGKSGIVVHCHAGCMARDVLAELRRLGLLARHSGGAPSEPVVRSDDRGDAARRTEIARRIWREARGARGSPVAQYLARREITIPVPPSLRYTPSLRRADGSHGPAMVARVDDPDGELIGVHRTWLDREDRDQWRRRDRASLGPIASGAVRLASAAEGLLIGEGIETCLAAMQATGQPAWAALSTSGIVALQLPPIVLTIVILADNDANGAGARAARTAAQRWLAEGRRVRIAMPPLPDTDFADVLTGHGYAEVSDVAA
jgi:hypothetical protein